MWSRSFAAAMALAVAVSLASALGVKAIPSVTPHQDNEATIRWEEDSLKDGSSSHNHRSARSFGGESYDQPQYLSREPYTAFGVWDDRTFRIDKVSLFGFGHGFMDERAGPDRVARYFFSDAEGVWPQWAKERTREAFDAWGGVDTDTAGLITGIAFQETTNPADAQIPLFWGDPPPYACGGLTYFEWYISTGVASDISITFDGGFNWYHQRNPAAIADDEWHFYSVALHEIGHVVGLDHQSDTGDLMRASVGEPRTYDCDGDGRTAHYFAGLDADSIEGVRDLYSIPKGPREGPSPTSTAPPVPRPTATPMPVGTPAPAPPPGVATITLPPPGEATPLYEGCNYVALTFPDGTPAQTVAEAVNPTAAVDTMWRHNAAEQRWEGFSPAFPQASDLLTVDFLDPVSVCVTAVLPPTPPGPPQPPSPTPAATVVPTATPMPSPLADPIGGATYSGKTSQRRPWEFGVSGDGGSVIWLDAEVVAHCTGGPPGGFTEFVYSLQGLIGPGGLPISKGSFSYQGAGLELSGRFTSPMTAEGEVRLQEEDTDTYPGYTLSCDSGTVTWTASAQ